MDAQKNKKELLSVKQKGTADKKKVDKNDRKKLITTLIYEVLQQI